jgi:hypothetical protein
MRGLPEHSLQPEQRLLSVRRLYAECVTHSHAISFSNTHAHGTRERNWHAHQRTLGYANKFAPAFTLSYSFSDKLAYSHQDTDADGFQNTLKHAHPRHATA